MKTAHELWLQAGGDTPAYDQKKYVALCVENGLLIPKKSKDPAECANPLCGHGEDCHERGRCAGIHAQPDDSQTACCCLKFQPEKP